MNRESWLEAMTGLLRPIFEGEGQLLPDDIRVSCGFPSTGNKSNRVGEHHWATERSEIFVSPVESDTLEVAGILLHELVHAAVGAAAKHGPLFKALATKLGLEGRMTATKVGAKAKAILEPLIEQVGQYPHDKMARAFARPSTDQARLITVRCECCGIRVLMERDNYVDEGLRLNCPRDCGESLIHSKEGK